MKKALFLDRDGVINREVNYLYKIKDFEFLEGVFDVCRYFQEKGYLLIIITNQAGIARGYYSESDYQKLTTWYLDVFQEKGIEITEVYHCPHHPDISGECSCRKPNIEMIKKAQDKYSIDLKNSILVGDKNSDIEAGINAKIENLYLIKTGHEIKENKFNVPILNNLKELKEK